MKFPLRQSKYYTGLLCAISFAVTFAVIILLYYVQGFAPFGDRSLAYMDANFQYLDIFSYLKDLFSGENGLAYTLSKGLGGTGISIFSYYLSSPFNLLVIFFEKANLVAFFDWTVALKLGMAGLTSALFLRKRFPQKINGIFVLLLSVSYALMQYSIAQSSNIMWLDGVYMLPLMLLGVHNIVRGKRPWLLVISTGCAMLFNWYSGGINCVFTIVWFVLEWLLARPEYPIAPEKRRGQISCTAKTTGIYIASMAGGVLLSAGLLVPTLLSLSSGGRGSLDLANFQNTFVSSTNLIEVLQNFTIGSISAQGSVSLFCGSLALLGCIGFFTSAQKSIAKKAKTGAVLLFSILIFYYQPFFMVFSLLNEATSYWYRYSYVTIFLLIFIAADYYTGLKKEKNAGWSLFKIAVVCSAILLVLSLINPVWELEHVYYTCFFLIVTAVLVAVYARYRAQKCFFKWLAMILMAVVLLAEMAANAYMLMHVYSLENAAEYGDYSVSQQEQIDQILENDDGCYRISQTAGYYFGTYEQRANYDEALAYHYASIATYTSDPDDRQRTLMDALGYRIEGDNMYIVNTSILGADSLLGVKYILSPYEINGLKKVDGMVSANEKEVYSNPYALPFALVYDENAYTGGAEYTGDPFVYQNELYSALLGEEVALYQPIRFAASDGDHSRTYTLSVPEGNYVLYGNLPWSEEMEGTLQVNGNYTTQYSDWTSPSVFYIPIGDGDTSASVVLHYETDNLAVVDEQFYVLDLDVLADVSSRLNARAADTISMQGKSARFEVTADEGDSLFLSIPNQNGWTVTRNGETIEPDMFADCMMSIPLTEGENVIEMKFSVPGLKGGIVVSGISVAGLVFLMVRTRRKRQPRSAR